MHQRDRLKQWEDFHGDAQWAQEESCRRDPGSRLRRPCLACGAPQAAVGVDVQPADREGRRVGARGACPGPGEPCPGVQLPRLGSAGELRERVSRPAAQLLPEEAGASPGWGVRVCWGAEPRAHVTSRKKTFFRRREAGVQPWGSWPSFSVTYPKEGRLSHGRAYEHRLIPFEQNCFPNQGETLSWVLELGFIPVWEFSPVLSAHLAGPLRKGDRVASRKEVGPARGGLGGAPGSLGLGGSRAHWGPPSSAHSCALKPSCCLHFGPQLSGQILQDAGLGLQPLCVPPGAGSFPNDWNRFSVLVPSGVLGRRAQAHRRHGAT